MYFNQFKITILSDSPEIENIIRQVPLPEDSGVDILTTTDVSKCLTGLDSLVIVDRKPEMISNLDDTSVALRILLLSGEQICSVTPEDMNKVNNVWLMPDGKGLCERLVKYYFTKFIIYMKTRADCRKMQICFETAIDSIPDLIWFKDTIGAHLKVNNGFCKAVDKTKEQIYKKGHYYIWDIPKEEYDQGDYVCLESEDVVMNCRKTCLFDEKVKTKLGMKQFKTYKSPLIDLDGTIIGTCGVAHDVTDLQNMNNELEAVLGSMPFAVVVEDRFGAVLSKNPKFNEYFPGNESIDGTDFTKWKRDSLPKKFKKIDGAVEYTVPKDEQNNMVIDFNQAPVMDIFKEHIGNVNIFRDVTVERDLEMQTIRNANTDFLTGLHNRRSLFEYLYKCVEKPQLTLITIDLDNFKKINDKFGHDVGDKAIVESARMFTEYFPKDFIARLGGDEFLVVIARTLSRSKIDKLVKGLFDKMLEFYGENEQFSVMTLSAGISYCVLNEGEKHNIEKLIKESDKALYDAKNNGKSKYCFYS